ncbi:MAG TPA: tetratricopeptide repeat protein, partial [Opitutaceae bacterium]|nr:tetratricopeptide repeat protein [Opitutaceae bacterium]
AHLVVSNRVNSVFYLYHELAALNHPAGVGSPEYYELQGMQAMQRGEYGPAEGDFTMAIRFGEKPVTAYQQRGLLRATENRMPEAREDFTAVIREDPKNPDGWFYRAHADLALGDSGAALSDFQRAQAEGSEAWRQRPDVVQFAAALGRQAGRP